MRKYISLGIFSAGSLALEVTLTRLLATLYYPPFIFVVLSLAVFGIALGAAWVLFEEFLRDEKRIPLWMALASAAVVVQAIGLPYSATLDSPIITGMLLVFPYIGIGVSLTCIFNALSEKSQTLYAYDLAGAGIGAVLVIVLLNLLSPINAMLLIAVLMLIAGVLYELHPVTAVLIPVAAILLIANYFSDFIAVDLNNLSADKPIQQTLNSGGEIIDTRYDAFARTDLVSPGANQPVRIYVDGAAASVVPPSENNQFLLEDIGLFAFVTAQPENVFIIGSGGGLDVWFGLQVGATNITAVEVNPNTVEFVRDIRQYNGDIYDQLNVRVLVDEGRSVLQREDTVYDLIYLSQVVTLSAERSGYALTENAVFTVEAFEDYWNHLSDDGYIALKLYDEVTTNRALSIIIELLNQQGFSDSEALNHTVILFSLSTDPATPMLIVRKTPFTEAEAISIGANAQQVGFESSYLPFVIVPETLQPLVDGIITYDDLISLSNRDLSAPTDNRPFFYQIEKGIPQSLNPLLIASGIVLALMIAGLVIYQFQAKPPQLLSASLYFAGLGAGFMLIELVLIQTTRLFIGHPTLAVTTTLSVLLIAGGLGSTWYYQQNPNPEKMKIWWIVALVILIAVWQVIWQPLSSAFIATPTFIRVTIAAVSIIPIAFLMGIPFAVGLRIVGQLHENYVAVAWLINGVFTVMGTILGVVIALLYGYIAVTIAGSLFYIIVAGASLRLRA